jgi:hypothetical protein
MPLLFDRKHSPPELREFAEARLVEYREGKARGRMRARAGTCELLGDAARELREEGRLKMLGAGVRVEYVVEVGAVTGSRLMVKAES